MRSSDHGDEAQVGFNKSTTPAGLPMCMSRAALLAGSGTRRLLSSARLAHPAMRGPAFRSILRMTTPARQRDGPSRGLVSFDARAVSVHDRLRHGVRSAPVTASRSVPRHPYTIASYLHLYVVDKTRVVCEGAI
jgi:hypothetical protein